MRKEVVYELDLTRCIGLGELAVKIIIANPLCSAK